MKNTLKALLAIASLFAVANSEAIGIKGAIAFSSDGSTAVYTPTSVDFTPDVSNAEVDAANGDYAFLSGTSVTFNDFTYNPFSSFVLWISDIDAGTYFTVTALAGGIDGLGNLSLAGTGLASMTGKDDSHGTWTFTGNDNGGLFTFSAGTNVVPDAGTTVSLLGFGLMGLVAVRRFRRNS